MTKEEMVIAAVAAIQTAEAQALSEKLAEMYEAGKLSVVVPKDITPFSQEDLDKAIAESTEALKAKIAELETKLSQKDADSLEEAIAEELAAMAQKLRDRTVKAPVDPVPVEEETKGTDAEA